MTQQDVTQMVKQMRLMGIPEKMIDVFIKEAIGHNWSLLAGVSEKSWSK